MTNDFQIEDGTVVAYTGSGTQLVLPDGVQAVGEAAFRYREDIVSVVLPGSLVSLGEEAFSGCTSLTEIALPAQVQSIGAGAFADCLALSRVTLPPHLVEIDDGTFLFCGALTDIRLPDTLTRIGCAAFEGTGLVEARIPESVAAIGENAFFECDALRHVNVPNRNATIGTAAFGCCYQLTEGYIAVGYPAQTDAPDELMYTLLALGTLPRHAPETVARACAFVQNNETLVMERVLKFGHIAAMTGILQYDLLEKCNIDAYVRASTESGQTEITALLLNLKGGTQSRETEFDL